MCCQRDLNRLKKWANSNLKKFKKGKCYILHLGRNNHVHQDRLGADWLGSSFAEKALAILVEEPAMCPCSKEGQ